MSRPVDNTIPPKPVAHHGPVLGPIDPNRAVQIIRVDPIGEKPSSNVKTIKPQAAPQLLEPYDVMQLTCLIQAEKEKTKDQVAKLWMKMQGSPKTSQDHIAASEQLAKLSKELNEEEKAHKENPQQIISFEEGKRKYPHLITYSAVLKMIHLGDEKQNHAGRVQNAWNQLLKARVDSPDFSVAHDELARLTQELKPKPHVPLDIHEGYRKYPRLMLPSSAKAPKGVDKHQFMTTVYKHWATVRNVPEDSPVFKSAYEQLLKWEQELTEPTSQSTKGKRGIVEVDEDEFDSETDLHGIPLDSCDVVRRKIRNFIDSGEMKIGEFCNAIGVSNKSYNGFMSQSGTYKGSGFAAYEAAWEFFKKRELKGIPAPKKKRTTAPATTVAAAAASNNVASVSIPGEETDAVDIYDTCDEIRRKINLHLKKDGVTQAGFLRDLMAQYHKSDRKIQSKQLTDFRSKKGADRGNTSCVYYASYVFFEKLRIKEGKKKTPTREKMEQIWGAQGGMNTTDRGTGYTWSGPGMVPREDRFGRVWNDME